MDRTARSGVRPAHEEFAISVLEFEEALSLANSTCVLLLESLR